MLKSESYFVPLNSLKLSFSSLALACLAITSHLRVIPRNTAPDPHFALFFSATGLRVAARQA
jgi:hypothetical protein